MAQQQSPFLEAAYGWDFGEGGWNSGMDQNLLKFSFMFDRNVDSVVAALPAAVNGQAHYLTTDNRLYFAVGNTYFSTPIPKWFEFKVRSTGATYQFNGTSAVLVDSPSELDSRLDSVELVVASLGTAAFENVAYFATQAELDVVEANAQAYTDVLRQALAGPDGPQLIGYGSRTVKEVLDSATAQLANVVYVIGSGSDQAAELSSALNSGNSVVLKGAIQLASPVTSDAAVNIVHSEGATITYTGAAGSTHVLMFRPTSALIVTGKLTIDCDNKAGIAFSCRAMPTAKFIKVEGVEAIDCFQAAPSNLGAHGIQIVNNDTGQPYFISVTGCEVSGVSRSTGDDPGSVCSGITVVDGLTTIVTGNRVSNVLTGNGTVDADGIKVFSDMVGSSYQRSNSLIKSNTISDCAGRFVKLQTRGKAVVEDNLLHISNIALIASWRGIDSQIADTDIRSNKINFTGAWSGGADMSVIMVQVGAAVDFTGQASNHAVHDNVINVGATATRITAGRAFMALLTRLETAAATASVDMYNNQITFEGGLNSATKACNIAFSVYVPDTWAAGATASVKIRNNQVSATNFLERLGGGANTNLTGKLTLLQISNNVLLSPDVIPVLPWVSGDRFTSDLLVYGNSVGRRGGEVVTPFDFSHLKPGCEFVIGGGASSGYINNPTSYTFSEVRHSGAFIQVDRGPTLYKSGFAPEPGAAITWSIYNL
jgi:hypothetical protein